MIVGVEPLGQFQGVLDLTMGTATTLAGTTGHGEQGVQGWQAIVALGAVETLRHRAERQRVAQHLVVPGKIAHGQQLDTGIFLQLPMVCAQLPTALLQAGLIKVALPVGFQGFFQFAVGADARET
ncbi:hypothetical protein D3C80_1608420 [compost metagenome]